MLIVALFVILVGNLLAFMIQTDGCKVKVSDVRFTGTNDIMMSALLYVPKDVTAKNPAPGILAIHGYINSRETQDGFAIEFARRGYVVLAIDQTGHGYSDPPAFANQFGASDGLRYLSSLNIVDKENIGLEGHSMGGYAIVTTASIMRDAYKSMVLESTAPGVLAPPGNATFPRNLAVVQSNREEFSEMHWGVVNSKDIAKGDKMKALFGTQSEVVVGKLYGSIADGTARKLYMPSTIHAGVHFSTEAIGDAIEWFQATLQGGNGLPPSDQIWYWKEIGNLIALIGMILLFFPVGGLLLRCSFFKELEEAPAKPKSAKGTAWWISAVIIVAVPALTWFPFIDIFNKLGWTPNVNFPESITTQVMIWALLVAVIAAALFLIWHFAFNRKAKATASDYGLTWGKKLDWVKIGKSFLLAVVVVLAGYLTLVLSALLFTVDYRFWVFAVKPMSLLHFQIFLGYLIPFILFFVALATVLHGQLRPTGRKGTELSLGSEMAINWALLVLGFVILLLVQYISLITSGRLAFISPSGPFVYVIPLFTIIAFQLLPLMTIVALAYTYFYRKTGHIYVGAFLCAMLVTWIVVASQAIHFAL
ncbi:MAG: alpha/beta fold hydrolase [Chloroflexota bacterium]|nr:MAG: alpha/beta fold hydrolase [Chloroflexota bacterium]